MTARDDSALREALLAIHSQSEGIRRQHPDGHTTDWECPECSVAWPCPTAQILLAATAPPPPDAGAHGPHSHGPNISEVDHCPAPGCVSYWQGKRSPAQARR